MCCYKIILSLCFSLIFTINSSAQSELKTIHVGKDTVPQTNPLPQQLNVSSLRIPKSWVKHKYRPPCQVEKLPKQAIIFSKEYREIIDIPDSLLFYKATLYIMSKDSVEEIQIINDTISALIIDKICTAEQSSFINLKFREPSVKRSTIRTYRVPGLIFNFGTALSYSFLLDLWEKDKFARHPKIKGSSIDKTYIKVVGGKDDDKEYSFEKTKIDLNQLPCDAQYYIFEFDLIREGRKYSREFSIRGKF